MAKKTKARKKKSVKRSHGPTAVTASASHVEDASGGSSSGQADGYATAPEAPEPQKDPKTSTDRGLKRSTPHDVDASVDPHAGAANDEDGWETVHRSKKAKKLPKKDKKKYPSIEFSHTARLDTNVRVSDLRDLILYIFADGVAPRWVSVSNRNQIRKIVTIMIPGVEADMLRSSDVDLASFMKVPPVGNYDEPPPTTNPDSYYPQLLKSDELHEAVQPLSEMFKRWWPVKAPGDDRWARMHSPLANFLTAPLPKRANEGDSKGGVKPAREPPGFRCEPTRITALMATGEELMENNYTLHPAALTGKQRKSLELEPGWVATKVDRLTDPEVPEDEIEEGDLTAGRHVLALDCEMVQTGGPKDQSLARISIVNWAGDVVLDSLVKPDKPVTDYVTQYSGITEEMLKPVTTTLKDIQNQLLDLITPRTILVGHSLESDLNALKLVHPFVVDTALIYPHPRGPPYKSPLRFLTQKYLNRQIQQGGPSGHDSIEDAKACLDLTRQKCEKGKLWGEFEGGGENLFRRLARAGSSYVPSGGPGSAGGDRRTSAAVDWGNPGKGPGGGATHALSCQDDDGVAEEVIRAVKGDPDGAEIRAGGVDFVWARMRELEALRGWWNKKRSHAPEGSGPPDLSRQYDEEGGASPLEVCLRRLVARLKRIHDELPPCTALVLFTGSGDPRGMAHWQEEKLAFKQEYNAPGSSWSTMNHQWTDREEQLLKRATRKARGGLAFIGVK